MTIARTLPLFAILMLSATPAFAADKLTEADVRAFYEESIDAYKLPYEQYLKKTDEMTADTFVSTAKVTVVMPGQPAATKTETMNKQDSLKASAQGYTAMKGATLDYQLKSITIAPDGKSAQVSDTMTIKGMSIPGAPAGMGMDAVGACNDVIALGPQGNPQVAASSCNMRMLVTKRL